MNPEFTRTVIALLTVFLAAACAGNLRDVVGEPPLAGLDGVMLDDSGAALDIALRNVNDRPLTLAGVSVELSLDGQEPVVRQEQLSLTIAPRGREVITLSLPPNLPQFEALARLPAGERQRLPWEMSLELLRPEHGPMSVQAEGWLHPVPGQENRFR